MGLQSRTGGRLVILFQALRGYVPLCPAEIPCNPAGPPKSDRYLIPGRYNRRHKGQSEETRMETAMLRRIKSIAIAVVALISCPVLLAQVQFTFPIPFTKGTSPSVAVSDGILIEVNQSGDDTVFQLGQISGQKVTWGPVRVFPWKM
jgi:hypothetical protein